MTGLHASVACVRVDVLHLAPIDQARAYLFQVVVWDLREEMMNDMGANIMVNFVEDAIVTVDRAQATTQVAPLLAAVPRDLQNMVKFLSSS